MCLINVPWRGLGVKRRIEALHGTLHGVFFFNSESTPRYRSNQASLGGIPKERGGFCGAGRGRETPPFKPYQTQVAGACRLL